MLSWLLRRVRAGPNLPCHLWTLAQHCLCSQVASPTAAVVTQGRLPDNFTSILQLSSLRKRRNQQKM